MSEDLAKFTIDGLVFGRAENSDTPLMRDLDLGQRCGMARPRAIRQLIRRMRKDGKLPRIHVRHTVWRSSMPRGGERSTLIEEFWPNLSELLAIVAQSGTAIGDALFDDLIRVYILAIKGLAPTAAASTAVLNRVEGDVAFIREHIEHDLLSRAHVGDNEHARLELGSAIKATAAALGLTFQKLHGALRKEFRVPGYLSLTLSQVSQVIAWLRFNARETPAGLLAQQLTFPWPAP